MESLIAIVTLVGSVGTFIFAASLLLLRRLPKLTLALIGPESDGTFKALSSLAVWSCFYANAGRFFALSATQAEGIAQRASRLLADERQPAYRALASTVISGFGGQ